MAKSLLEYAELLDSRDLRWPAAPKIEPVNATPSIKPIEGIRAVTWSLYGTLMRINDGELLLRHPQTLRMEVAIEKTIHEFNMWNSMTRRPGRPADLMMPKYLNVIEDTRLRSSHRKGDVPEIDAAQVWRTLLGLLDKKEYRYDEGLYGDLDELAQKVAYFFHASLQGTEATPGALMTLSALSAAGLRQATLADAQCFSLAQLTRALRQQGTLLHAHEYLPESLNVMSYEWGVRKPSSTLYAQSILSFQKIGIEPHQILHVGTNLRDDLSVAKSYGFRTVLFADDKSSLKAAPEDLKNPETRPNRLITKLPQILEIVQV